MEQAAQIQFLLKIKGIRQKDVASKLEVSPAVVSQVINGKRRSARIEKALAKITGIKINILFPKLAA